LKVKIVAVATDEEVIAEIRPARLDDVILWRRWKDQMPARAEDAHWRWDEYILMAEMYPQQLACFILLAESEAQGLMLLELEHENDLGKKDIHGLRISSAPWNRGPRRRYKGVGTALLTRAVLLSVEKGYKGRLWLESLPGAEDFYRHLGLVELPERDSEMGLKQFKLNAKDARTFLEARKGIWDE
jgi:GNAT superfamily N-acetyltransferase